MVAEKINSGLKHIVITGGTISGVGKGVVATSIAVLLKEQGYGVTFIKIDPYLNTDAGNLSPLDHGEVFVLEDGAEVDLDFGNYERFLNVSLTNKHSITAGKVYKTIIDKERAGDYLGQTVRVVPQVTDYIQECIIKASNMQIKNGSEFIKPNVCIIELGGTVGDIEASVFIEALRQLKMKWGKDSFIFVSVEYIPFTFEAKTKPVQESAKKMRQLGIKPDMIFCRTNQNIDDVKSKISLFCEIEEEMIIWCPDKESIYDVPNHIAKQGALEGIMKMLKLEKKDSTKDSCINKMMIVQGENIDVALVGKYTELKDSYISVIEALKISAAMLNISLNLVLVDSEKIDEGCEDSWEKMENADAIVVPGGFGFRGIEGKIKALSFARNNKKPTLGICFGFQLAVIEFAKNVLLIKDAKSEEFKNTTGIDIIKITEAMGGVYGGKMRLGGKEVFLRKNSKISKIYNSDIIIERHRHRYDVNSEYIAEFEKNGLLFTGRSNEGILEVFELAHHPFYIGTQYHPEFIARPANPHRLFDELLRTALNMKNKP